MALGAAAWWQGWLKMPEPPAPVQQEQAQTPAEPDNGLSAASDTSDAALAQDTAAIDAQMSATAQDSTNITSAMSDKPVSQSY